MKLPVVLDAQLNAIHMKGIIQHKVCHFMGDSSIGKTFLFSLVTVYCMQNQLRCVNINYNQAGQTVSAILTLCTNADIVLLDNADLYDYKAVIAKLKKAPCIVLVSHHEALLPPDGEACYAVHYVDNTVSFAVD